MAEVNNITNQIKPQSANTSGLFGVAKPDNGKQQVNGLGDFLALLMQNIQQTSEPQESGKPELKTQIQELLQQSPEELTALLQQGQSQKKDSENSSPLLSLLGAMGIQAEEIGLDTEKLPPSLIGQATAIQAQLLSQKTPIATEQPVTTEQIIATATEQIIATATEQIIATATEKPITTDSKIQNNNPKASQEVPATNTPMNPSFTPVVGTSASLITSDTADTQISSTENIPQPQNSKTAEIASGQATGGVPTLSFNAGDVLKSFLPDEAGRKPRQIKNVTANIEQPSSEKTLPKQSSTPMTQQTQQQPTQTSSTPIVVPTPSSIDVSMLASSTSSFMTSLISGDSSIESMQLLNTTSRMDVTTDTQAQGRPITAQNFASFTMAKASHFQSPSSQQIYMNMQRNAAAKVEQLTLQLEPQELGRIEINMKFGKNGSMKAHLIVEKQDTMGLLQRDANALENALKGAGIELGDSALSFDLASSEDHFDKTKEQQENDNNFSLEMMTDKDTTTQTDDTAFAANQNGYIRQDSVNILI